MARLASTQTEIVSPPISQDAGEQRLVFNGGNSGMQAGAPMRNNRPAKPRKRSPLALIAGIACVSLLIVLYVWNKITVNRLMEEVNTLQMQIEKITSTNKVLVSEIDQKERLDLISKRAKVIGMVAPKEPPVYFEVGQAVLETAHRQDEAAQ
jgi:cell division protein FtsB